MAKVVIVIHEEGGRFGASFPDFPGCTTVATDPDALLVKAADALTFHVAGMVQDDRDVPTVRTLAQMWDDQRFQEDRADAALVSTLDVELPGKTVRVNITLNESTLDVIDRAAKAKGESRSGFLVNAALKRVKEAARPQELVVKKDRGAAAVSKDARLYVGRKAGTGPFSKRGRRTKLASTRP